MKPYFSEQNSLWKLVKQFLFQSFWTLFGLDPLDNVVPTGKTFALAKVSFPRPMHAKGTVYIPCKQEANIGKRTEDSVTQGHISGL